MLMLLGSFKRAFVAKLIAVIALLNFVTMYFVENEN